MEVIDTNMYVQSNKIKSKAKLKRLTYETHRKSMNYKSVDKKEFKEYSNYYVAQKCSRRAIKCLNMLEKGLKPVFRMIPAYRPYKFYEKLDRTNTNDNSAISTTPTKIKPMKTLKEILEAQKENEAKFFQSVNSVMENCSISDVKLLEEKKINTSNDVVEALKKRVLFLDGANDSASDDEDNRAKKHGTRKSSHTSYSSLPIFKKSSVIPNPGIPTRVSDQIKAKMKAVEDYTVNNLTNNYPSCDNIQKIKRKISFDVKSQEKTILEEKLSCATKSSAHQVNFIKNEVTVSKTNDASVDNIMESFVERRIIVSSISDGVNEAIKVNNKLENNSNVGEQDEDYLSTSALYDIINDYQPQEGTSKCYSNKLLSPKTPESSRDSLSQELRNLKTRDHNSFEYYSGSKFISSEEDSMDYPVLNGTINDIIPINKNLMHLSGSSSDIICGQKSSQNSSEMLKESSIPSYNFIHYKPQYKPPTRRDVEQSLCNLEIPQVRAQEPFYSDANDATGSLEIGYNVLKIQTMTSADAQDFESTFSGIDDFRKKFFPKVSSKSKQHAVENSRYSYCKESNCMITPVKKPPSRQEVKNWLKEKSLQPKDSTKSKLKKKKIYFRPSQDGFSDDSLDLSLTLTPLTPKENTPSLKTPESESNVESDSKESSLDSDVTLTPKSSRSSSLITKSKRRRRIDRSIVLRKSALLSHSSEHSGVISGVTLNNTYGFKNSLYNYQNAKASIKHEYLTILAMEIHVNTRGNFKPNPEYDSIQAIFYCISNDIEDDSSKPRKSEGLFIVEPNGNESFKSISASTGMLGDIKCVKNELELFKEFTNFLVERDPDILIGYEIQMLSWGYLIERCFHLGINLIPELSRVKDKNLKFNEKETGDLRVTGRVVLDFWRLLRHEIALQSYTLQSTVYEILQQRIPKYSFKDLTTWWNHYTNLYRHRTINYYLNCVRYILKLVDQLDLVGRTSELARLFGIQFYEVLSRGSQFRVESMMLRLAKPLNYVAVSPSVQQRANMKAPEHIALVLEPESKLYTDPVIVLDFQSLYPSIIIAYNYCFSTCIGKVELLGKSGPFEFAATNLKISKERIKFLLKKNQLNFSPCGVGFVKKSVRDGIMPRMLREILDTRLMVKKSMKENKDDALLQKVLHNRQLGLKLIANVTYGYTAANFSGRMPAVELGDSIVSKARETLQRTIALVDSNKKWGVRVVYGDTDSLFVHCPGKSKEEAFAIGEQIVEAVGKENPDPVKLKLEKVYQPCILQTKKRYVGYMYESPEQKDPVYDAKGIETVRRDGCPAVSKMLEKCLRILFETKDVSRVKKYCVKQFNKIILGRISIQDLTFAKEFRGFTGYRPGACVPSLELAKRWVSIDKRAEPRRGERVPYVIINGPPGLPLIRLVRSPYELLNDPALKPNALYYITRVIIPPLNRCFNLIGADLHQWFHQMPRKQLQCLPTVSSPSKKSTISQYFVSTLCAICGTQTQDGLCEECRKRPQETVIILNEKVRQWETSYNNCKLICSTCSQILDEPKCISLNCPVLYRLHQTNRDLQQTDHIRQLLDQHFEYF
ncbi:hypothetical protein HHI36_012402 [Cryptolaemus montrouzieri]|uniref:DNA polymerase n=1 Tax=Cryptolaemus montrouzieri TaxID=559131 RepID=A0ABD2NE50_9CUCU